MNGQKIYTLDNGLTVALMKRPLYTFSGILRVKHGRLYENPKEEGLAHLLEHCLVGSKNYGSMSAEKVENEFGYFNAGTGLQHIDFTADSLEEDLELFLAHISQVVFSPDFSIEKINQERKRVLREIVDYRSQPGCQDFNDLVDEFYGEGSPHKLRVLGDEAVITNATLENLQEFYARGFFPNNMQLILVGALPDNVESIIEKYFSDVDSAAVEVRELPHNRELDKTTILHRAAPDLNYNDNPNESNLRIKMAVYAPTFTHPESAAVNLVTHQLGGLNNSRLHNSVSKNNGLAYNIQAIYDGTDNHGYITVDGTVKATKREEALNLIFDEFKRLQDDIVNEDELRLLKKKQKYFVVSDFENNKGIAEELNTQLNFDISFIDYEEQVNALTAEDIQLAAQRYLPSDRENGKYVLLLRDPLYSKK